MLGRGFALDAGGAALVNLEGMFTVGIAWTVLRENVVSSRIGRALRAPGKKLEANWHAKGQSAIDVHLFHDTDFAHCPFPAVA
jgi:hypothetical protein